MRQVNPPESVERKRIMLSVSETLVKKGILSNTEKGVIERMLEEGLRGTERP